MADLMKTASEAAPSAEKVSSSRARRLRNAATKRRMWASTQYFAESVSNARAEQFADQLAQRYIGSNARAGLGQPRYIETDDLLCATHLLHVAPSVCATAALNLPKHLDSGDYVAQDSRQAGFSLLESRRTGLAALSEPVPLPADDDKKSEAVLRIQSWWRNTANSLEYQRAIAFEDCLHGVAPFECAATALDLTFFEFDPYRRL